MKPYYQDSNVTIYHGDCRDILPELEAVDVVITDPPWVNQTEGMNTSDPMGLFKEVSTLCFPIKSSRAVIILGCDTDPRILTPIQLPFFDLCWIKRVPVFFKGPKFIGGDVAYVFGDFKSPTGRGGVVYSQEFNMVSQGKRENSHPAPRNQKVINGLVGEYSRYGEVILDPFLGSGTTAWAAKYLGRECIGIEIAEEYCEIAANRCRLQSVMNLRSREVDIIK